MQDTATQAMTEVALGLSMAFFALLILALISVSLPSDVDKPTLTATATIPIEEQIQLEGSENYTSSDNAATHDSSQRQTVVLHWQGQFFDLKRKMIDAQTIDKSRELIVAVSAESSLNELLSIQAAFIGRDIKLTKLTKEWEISLANASPRQ